MDFEREMQKALKVIFQNIQALDENRNEFQGTFHCDPALTSKRWRPKKRSASFPNQRTCHFIMTTGKETRGTIRRKISLFLETGVNCELWKAAF